MADYPPWTAFIDRLGKAAVLMTGRPRDTRPGHQIVDRNGEAVAIRAPVPHYVNPCNALANGVASTPHCWIPGFTVGPEGGAPNYDSWLGDWSCNEYSENFDAPPLAEPPWDVLSATYSIGRIHGQAYLYKFPDWPAVNAATFYWLPLISGIAPTGLIWLTTKLRSGFGAGPWKNHGYLAILASATPWVPAGYWFEFYFRSEHSHFGSHASGTYHYASSNPWVLDGETFTATIYEAGRVECSFYGVNWNNGGPA